MTDTIVLLHGMARTARCWRGLERKLRCAGYRTVSITYPSRQLSIEGCADYVRTHLLTGAFWQHETHVHFITHSMGGLVLAAYFNAHKDEVPMDKVGRAVMLGPPWRGSEIADLWAPLGLFHRIFGPAGAQMTTGARGQPHPPLPCPVAVIAGRRSWLYPDAWAAFREPNDGRVSVARSHVDGEVAHTVVPTVHSWLMNHRDTVKLVATFFERPESTNQD